MAPTPTLWSSQPWLAELTVNEELATHLITSQFPELSPLRISHLGEGWDNFVYQVNDQYVFRFPRRNVAVAWLNNEGWVLPKFASRLSVEIPKPIFFGQPNERYPWPFLGYRFLDGRPACGLQLSQAQRYDLIEPIAHFLKALHRTPKDDFITLRADIDETDRLNVAHRTPAVLENLQYIENHALSPHVGTLRSIIASSQGAQDIDDKVLSHGDMYARHILVDNNAKLCGIIDWGDVCFANPALDLQIAFTFFSPSSRQLFFDIYGPIPEQTMKLAQFRGIYSACGVTVYAHNIGDENLLREGISALEMAANI